MLSPGTVSQDRGCTSPADGPTDARLLARFVQAYDGQAFELLVRRYGPMVLGVCRRVLGDATDAEDAFQATFLVLVKKARSIAKPDLLGNWLYGVAYRIARKARAQRAKRAQQRTPAAAMSSPDPQIEVALRELQAQLDEELQGLPAKYRAPLVLCYLEGLSNREAAERLGWPVGSISHRLARGRELLRERLQDRHPNASSLVLGALPLWAAASPDTLARLQTLVVKSALELTRGEANAVLSPAVQSLGGRALRNLASSRWLRVTLAGLGVALVLSTAAAAGWTAFGPPSGLSPFSPQSGTPAGSCCHGAAPAEEP